MLRLPNIPAYVIHWAEMTLDADALCVLDRHPRVVSYGKWADRICSLSHLLAARGVVSGDFVPVLCNLDDRLLTAMLAIASLGAVSVPIVLSSSASEHVLAEFAKLHSLKLICQTGRFRALTARVLSGVPEHQCVSLDDEPSDLPVSSVMKDRWHDWVASRQGDQPFYANHTSGSTANPKITLPSDQHLLLNAFSCIEYFGSGPDLRMFCTFVFHSHEVFARNLVVGGCSVMLPFNRLMQSTAVACCMGRVNHVMMNPPTAERMLHESSEVIKRLRGPLRVIEVGGGVLSAEVARELERKTAAKVIEAYGSTETAGVALASRLDDHAFTAGLVPLPSYVVEIEAPNAERTGELVIGGPAVVDRYVVDPPGEVRLKGQRFFTRDLVRQVRDGIQVLGRIDNAVKLLGTRQPLEPIERALRDALLPLAETVQCVELEPTGLSRYFGSALLALVLIRPECRDSIRVQLRQVVRRALRAARLEAYLTAPQYFIFVDETELALQAGKLSRRHARERFPLRLADWLDEDRARLLPAPLLAGDVLRAIRRLLREARAFRNPIRVFLSAMRRWLGTVDLPQIFP